MKYYDLYINNQWTAQYSNKKDAVSEAKEIWDSRDEIEEEGEERIYSIEVIACDSYDPRDGGTTVFEKEEEE